MAESARGDGRKTPVRGKRFDRAGLMTALKRIGEAAVENRARLELLVYGGSALMLASNFRYSTEDVDIAEIGANPPEWFAKVVTDIADENDWSADWINDAVQFHLSPLASRSADHVEFGTFPNDAGAFGLNVLVPTPEYMLALKLKAMRVLDPVKGRQEADDVFQPMRVLRITSPEQAIATMARFFPKSASAPEKQRFLLRNLQPTEDARSLDAPSYAR